MSTGAEQYGGGGSIIDQVFGPLWATDTKRGRSAKSIYDKIITIGTGFGNTAFVRATGNDATAIVGNILFPFQTVQAAYNALPALSSGLLFIDSDLTLTDANAPFGLKKPNTIYDVFIAPGKTVTYTGSYGVWISANTLTSGNIYGDGNITVSSGVFTGGSGGYAMELSNVNSNRKITFNRISFTNGAATAGGFRFGTNAGFGCVIDGFRINCTSGGVGLNFGANIILSWEVSETILSTTNNTPVVIDNTGSTLYALKFKNGLIQQQSGGSTDTGISINYSANFGFLKFINMELDHANGTRNSMIKFLHTGNREIYFEDSKLPDRGGSAAFSFQASGGAVGIKYNNTIARRNTSGTITQLLTVPVGLVVDPNLTS